MRKQFSIWTADELCPSALATSVLSSLLISTLEVVFVISFSALVLAGSLATQWPQALGFILIGNAVVVGIITLPGSYPGSVSLAQDMPGAVSGVVAATITA